MREGACLIPPARDVADEIAKAPPRLRRDFVRVQDSRRSKTEWNPFSAGKHVKFPDGFIAKAPLWHIDDALKGHIVGRLMDDAQIRKSITDLSPTDKEKTAEQPVEQDTLQQKEEGREGDRGNRP